MGSASEAKAPRQEWTEGRLTMHSDVMYPKIPPYEKSEEEWKESQPVNGL